MNTLQLLASSGLYPHISRTTAEFQILRVAKAHGLSKDAVRDLDRHYTDGRTLGMLAEPVLTIPTLNRALAQQPIAAVAP